MMTGALAITDTEGRQVGKVPVSEHLDRLQRVKGILLRIDRNGLLWAVDFRHPYLNRAMGVLSRLGDWDVWTVGLLVLLSQPGKPRRIARKVLPRILTALGICFSLKRVAKRTRPSTSVEGFAALLVDPDPYSFPSSHSACSWAACLAMARELGGVGWLLAFYAALMSYSRIHVGAHYPLDVLAGTGVGVTVGLT